MYIFIAMDKNSSVNVCSLWARKLKRSGLACTALITILQRMKEQGHLGNMILVCTLGSPLCGVWHPLYVYRMNRFRKADWPPSTYWFKRMELQSSFLILGTVPVLSDETESDISPPSVLHFISILRTSESAHPLHHALNDRCAQLDMFFSSEQHCSKRLKKTQSAWW